MTLPAHLLPTEAELLWAAEHDLARLAQMEALLGAEREAREKHAAERVEARRWRSRARPDQLPPEGWTRRWYVRGGRFGGKTWTGSHVLAEMIREHPVDTRSGEPGDPPIPTEWGVIAPTFADARDTCIEGPSGLLRALGLPVTYPSWNRSMGQLKLPTGQVVYVGGADDGALRVQGKNLAGCWADEIGLWKKWQLAWDESIAYAVRIGPARIIATGTPKRNMPARALIKRLIEEPETPVTRLRSADNRANIAETAWDDLSKAAATTLGRQELEGELLDAAEGALWHAGLFRHVSPEDMPPVERSIVSIDPSGSKDGDTFGIIGLSRYSDGRLAVRADRTLQDTPEKRYEAACLLAYQLGAGEILYERLYGGDGNAAMLRASWERLVATKQVIGPCPRTTPAEARGSKSDRAQIAVQAYELEQVDHVPMTPTGLTLLEDELCTWTEAEDWSPGRLDALVHGVRHLLSVPRGIARAVSPASRTLPRGPQQQSRVRVR